MSHLLDVNFLVALFDSRHANHDAAHYWFAARCAADWATCSITEAGCVRVLSNPAYRNLSATPGEVLGRLGRFCESGGHTFWSDDISPRTSLDDRTRARLQGHGQVTDFHLAALALRHRGCLVTFDGRLRRSLARTPLESTVMLVE